MISDYKPKQGDELTEEFVASIDPDNLIAQANAILTGGTSPSAFSIFYALGIGANNGKFKISIDGTIYDNVAINLSSPITSGANIEQTSQDNHEHPTNTRFVSQSFLTGANTVRATNIRLYCGGGPNNGDIFSVQIYACDVNDKPTGSALATDTVTPSITDPAYIDYTITCELTSATKYCIVVKGIAGTDTTGLYFKGTASSYANGKMAISTDSGSTWTVDTNKDLLFIITTLDYTYEGVASAVQTAIRALTSKLETCVWSTNKFIITGDNPTRTGSILKLMTPSAGTDISGVNATRYLDLGTNATETAGTGSDYYLKRLNKWGTTTIDKPFKTLTWANSSDVKTFTIPAGVSEVLLRYKGYALSTNSEIRMTVNSIAGTNYATRIQSGSISTSNPYWQIMTQSTANNPAGQGELLINVNPVNNDRIFAYGKGEGAGNIMISGYVLTGSSSMTLLTFDPQSTNWNAEIEIYLK